MIWKGAIIVSVGVTLRLITAFFVTSHQGFTTKGNITYILLKILIERIFMALCWLPKATVQATLSGQFLAHAKKV